MTEEAQLNAIDQFQDLMIDRLKNSRFGGTIIAGWYLFFYDYQYRYGISYFGYLWPLLKAVLTAVPLILLGRALDLHERHGSLPFELYLFSGFLGWSLFWDSIQSLMTLTRRCRKMFQKVNVSVPVILVATMFHIGPAIFVNLVFLVGTAIYLKVPPVPTFLFGLIPLSGLLMTGMAIGLPIAGLTFLYQDASYGIGYFNQLLFWATPVVTLIPDHGLLRQVYLSNPLTHLIAATRGLFFGQEYSILYASLSFGLALVLFCISLLLYRRISRLAIEYVL